MNPDDATIASTSTDRPAGAAPVATVRLEVVAGPDVGRTADVAARRCIVGRAASADLVLNDPKVSAFHAELCATHDGVSVRDLQSRNGTFYAGARVLHAVVPPGGVLTLGDTQLATAPGESPADHAPYEGTSFGELLGQSSAMCELFGLLARLAPSDLSLLIEGPTGTGKELVARAIHAAGRHPNGPFIVLDCASVPSSLAESTLFGHEKGAFTGATERRAGVFEAADGGTLFMDEIGELPVELQPRLLRALERREVTRVGSTRPQPVRVRVVSATWRDVREAINHGGFREDLYHRLAQARVVVPALSERVEDIPLLVRQFLRAIPADVPGARRIGTDALLALAQREYTGNVRELRNVVERASVIANGPVITAADLSFERVLSGEHRAATRATLPPPPGAAVEAFKDAKRTAVDEFERAYLAQLLERTGNNLTRASVLARIGRAYLRELCRRHGLRDDEG